MLTLDQYAFGAEKEDSLLSNTHLSTWTAQRTASPSSLRPMSSTLDKALGRPRPRTPAACPPRSPCASPNQNAIRATGAFGAIDRGTLRGVRRSDFGGRLVCSDHGFNPVLSSSRLRTVGARALASALRTNTRIDEILLSDQDLRDEGMSALALSLGGAGRVKRTAVHKLDLRNNNIGDEGATALAELLLTNRSITSINLRDNSIGNAGCRELAFALSRSTSVRHFDIRGNKFLDDGTMAIREALDKNKRLRMKSCTVEY